MVLALGVTTTLTVLAEVFQVNVSAPDAESVAELPEQTLVLPLMFTVGFWFTTNERVCVPAQLLASSAFNV